MRRFFCLFLIFVFSLSSVTWVFADEQENKKAMEYSENLPVVANAIVSVALFGVGAPPIILWQILENQIDEEMRTRLKVCTPEQVEQDGDKLLLKFNGGQQLLTIRQNKCAGYGYLRFIDHEFEGRCFVRSFDVEFALSRIKEGSPIVIYQNHPVPTNYEIIVSRKGYIFVNDLQDERLYAIKLPYAEELAKKMGIY